MLGILERLRNPLFLGLVLLQLAGALTIIVLSFLFSWFVFPRYFLIYAVPQITVGIIYLLVDFNKSTRRYFVAGTAVLAAIWFVMNVLAIYYIAVIDFAPYFPGKTCATSPDPNSPYYCPELNDVANNMKSQTFILMQMSLIGILPSVAILFVKRV
jgi:hypothetical protein